MWLAGLRLGSTAGCRCLVRLAIATLLTFAKTAVAAPLITGDDPELKQQRAAIAAGDAEATRKLITLKCDFTSAASRGEPLHHHWNVSNRISPMRGFAMPVGDQPRINIVRPLGGKAKKGRKLIEEDTCKWDGNKFVYDWRPLHTQIANVQGRAILHQLMIDNPPWAFQRGLDLDGGSGVETYGNAWPPNDPEAWSRYIRAMLEELVATYGRETAGKWRYCIGREIGTKGHWRGTMQEFFEHYRNTERAVRAVLPEAKVGTHFLWASSKHSFGPDFVRWCKRNRVRYDFIGVSYYPFYNRPDRIDLQRVYRTDFAPIKDLPEWNPSATLEIHEFALIERMSKAGNSYDSAPARHQDAFTVMLAKMMYRHGMKDVFRWGTGEDRLAEQALAELEGMRFFANSRDGEPVSRGNMIDAIFAHDAVPGDCQILIACYHANPKASGSETVAVSATLPVPPGSVVRIRETTYGSGRPVRGAWTETKTGGTPGKASSTLNLRTKTAPFSFRRIELDGPAPGGTRRILTEMTP